MSHKNSTSDKTLNHKITTGIKSQNLKWQGDRAVSYCTENVIIFKIIGPLMQVKIFGRFCFEKCGKTVFLWLFTAGLGNTAWVAMAGLGTVQP